MLFDIGVEVVFPGNTVAGTLGIVSEVVGTGIAVVVALSREVDVVAVSADVLVVRHGGTEGGE